MTATLDAAMPDAALSLVVLLHNQLIIFTMAYATYRSIYVDLCSW